MTKIKKAQGLFSWVVVLSECSHVFCCVLPSLFSIISILVGIGLIGAMPMWMQGFHEVMHTWEIPLMMVSGVIVLIGWGLYYLSKKMDCHDTGCVHGACEPQKKDNFLILKVATFLFLVNVTIYMVFHQGLIAAPETVQSGGHIDSEHSH